MILVSSVLPSRSLSFASCYLSSLGRAQTPASHLRAAPGMPERLVQRTAERFVGETYGRQCLLDHAAEFQTELEDLLGEPVTVDADDALLAAAGKVWRRAAVATRRSAPSRR